MNFYKMKLTIAVFTSFLFSQELQYSMEDYNPSSPTFGLNVWFPEYENHITLHYFTSQG